MTPLADKKSAEGFEEELIGYNFLRNIWGTHFFDRQEVGSEDKLDRINKIVGMMKAQVRLMITHESNHIHQQLAHPQEQKENDGLRFLQVELERTKEALERSRMREEELEGVLIGKQRAIQAMERQNNELRTQVFDLKQAKNRCEERIIELSNHLY
jgi:ribosomal protein L18